MVIWQVLLLCILAFAVGAAVFGFVFYRLGQKHRKEFAEAHIKSAEEESLRLVNEAAEKAEALKKAKLIEAKESAIKLKEAAEQDIERKRQDLDRDTRERLGELTRSERRLQQKEENLDKKTDKIEKLEEQLLNKNKHAAEKLEEAEQLRRGQMDILERLSGFSTEQAKEHILSQMDELLDHEKALKISAFDARLKDECDARAREQISLAISRLASETVSELAVSVVALPSDEMKGRIIGREGRNIRMLEQLTGVDLIIDDTPEAITLSSHNRVQREVARIALERLIQDGRIHPARIEEMVDKAGREVIQRMKQEGEKAVLETNVGSINGELVALLGRLHFRTSYSQNVLVHSVEVAHLAGIMAAELGVDAMMARRAGLLHDIGKAFNQEIEGSHVQLGVELCKKYKEPAEVLHAVEAHHGDVETRTVIAALVQAADAVSAARPGARIENFENYIKRLAKLEEICMSYDGVEKSFAIQAGREVRVMIKPDSVNDDGMIVLARDIALRIEQEMEYPGQIKVHLIRESRAIDFAK